MIPLNELLLLKFPQADFLKDIKLREMETGIEIYEWNLKESKPTKEVLMQWEKELKEKYKHNKIEEKRKSEYPPTEELIIALWESVVEDRPESLQDIQSKRRLIKMKYPK